MRRARPGAVCHGTGAVGNNFLAPSLVDPNAILLDDPSYIRTRIRRSGPSVEDRPDVVYPCLTGGTTMPFWSRDRLSDQDVEDLIAFVALARAERERGNETFDSVSIWCLAARVNFADARFEAP